MRGSFGAPASEPPGALAPSPRDPGSDKPRPRAFDDWPPQAELDPVASPVLARELPTLAACLQEVRVAGALERVMLAGRLARYRVLSCRRVQAHLSPPGSCLLRFELEIGDRLSGATWRHLVTVRVWPDATAAHAYVRQTLDQALERARDRAELEPLAAPVGVVEELNASYAAFPLDAGSLALLAATEPGRVAELLTSALRDGRRGPAISGARVGGAYPGPGPRWVLRYEAEAVWRTGAGEAVTLYATLRPGDWGRRSGAAAAAIAHELRRWDASGSHAVPEFLGFARELGLGLFGAVAGAPQLDRLVADRVRGRTADPWALTLEGAVESAARVASFVHRCGVRSPTRWRGLDDLEAIRSGLEEVAYVSPNLADRLEGSLEVAGRGLEESRPQRPGPAHGELRPRRLLFTGSRCAVIGLDAFCWSEPARDLGSVVAGLAVSAAATGGAGERTQAVVADLRSRLVDAYVAAGDAVADPVPLLERTRAYEHVALLGLALESWRSLEADRLLAAVSLLDRS